ncbi:hypothetical protein ACTZWT_05960 [Rhodopseudomonas sp. NSM]|uniref:hypothetical protein n=1 Tax=Rhodopseudomonas sp. NSM TaxID=3457630 RepID=UPI004036D5A1
MRLERRHPETGFGYQALNKMTAFAAEVPGDTSMRTLSLILAFAFVVAGPSVAGSSETGLPGAGVFSFIGCGLGSSDAGSPVAQAAAPMLVAAR